MKKTRQAPLGLDALNLRNTDGEKAAGTLNVKEGRPYRSCLDRLPHYKDHLF